MGLLNGTARNKFLPAELVEADRVAYRMACLGFPLLTLGLVLGSVWGKLAWGDYWNWDPKEMWSLASWFAYLGYFHFRAVFPGRWRWASSLLLIFAGAVVLLTLLTAILPKLSGGGGGMHAYGG
jgi:ABC-type transport system involved in cytochrome c biogenesis permease subunit